MFLTAGSLVLMVFFFLLGQSYSAEKPRINSRLFDDGPNGGRIVDGERESAPSASTASTRILFYLVQSGHGSRIDRR